MHAPLSVERVSKSFGQIRAVQEVSFDVRAGEIYGLLGPNGAGKTTTISLVCGLLRPEAGEIRVEGVSVWKDPLGVRRQLGVVPQEIALYGDMTGRENLEFWGRLAGLDARTARARTEEMLVALSLVDRGNDILKNYSGGMKRRINLGAALLHKPKVLLLDEPTVGIDPQARANILEFVRGLTKAGTAILYTTHYLEEAETLCDRVGIIDGGRLLAEGTLAELQQRLGGDRVFVMEGGFHGAQPQEWEVLRGGFRILQHTDRQLVVAAMGSVDPAEGLRRLLSVPATVENVTFKRPSLNDVFLQLTGRDLRE
jgi:ABC-2 type transport system ATP-binding protein